MQTFSSRAFILLKKEVIYGNGGFLLPVFQISGLGAFLSVAALSFIIVSFNLVSISAI